MKEQMEQQSDLEKLGQKILTLERPILSNQKRDILKNNILKSVSVSKKYDVGTDFVGVVSYIRRFADMLNLSSHKRVMMKERVFSAIENIHQRSFFVQNVFGLYKRLISGVVVASMFFAMFSFVNVNVSVVMAETFTTLESFTGDVHIVRDGKELVVKNGMEFFEGDKISTGDDGMVVVRYFDDSITRLAANTDVVINRLFKPEGTVETYVEVSLIDGVVWSRVLSLVGDESAFVLKANDVSATTKKATFNSALKDKKLELDVFNRSVDVHKDDKVSKILKGQQAVINGYVEVSQLSESKKNVAWVKDNLESDKQYLAAAEDRLLDAKVKSMGSDVSIGTSFREDVSVFLTFNDVDKQKKELDLAEKAFVAAEIKLSNPNLAKNDRAEVEKGLVAFYDEVKSFDELVKEVGYSDKKYSDELKQYLDNKIMTHQKELSVILPDSPLYEAKRMVDNVALVNVDNDTELVEKKLDQVSEKLATAEDAAILGQTDVARAVVDDSKRELDNVEKIVDTMTQNTPGSVNGLAPKINEVKEYLTVVDTSTVTAEGVAADAVVAVPGEVQVGTTDSAAGVALNAASMVPSVSAEPVAATAIQSVPSAATVVPAQGVVPVGSVAPAQVAAPAESLVIPAEPLEEEEPDVVKGGYGIYIKGGKPLPPGLGN
ncbi:MAG: DUF5667 domain-containing protein [Candidatus Gracilibacteria bacterium]|jgi:hypothetical protein